VRRRQPPHSVQGERQVLVADRNATRAQLVAKVSGATVVDLDALPRDPSLRHAIDATGSVAVMARLLDVLAGGGTLALVGISHGRLDLDPNLLVEREIALVGCHAFADELAPAVAMLGDLAPALSRFVAEEIAIGEIPAAYQRLIAGASGGLKTIVRMERG
jgi:(R,R)-butanediol dehydrogenase/meso-butanediol dehydrogenase/diacetyl reductase